MKKQIEITEHTAPGYAPLAVFEAWRVALMNDSPKTTVEGLTYFQVHRQTDEVFILLKGACTLLVAGDGAAPGIISACPMQAGKVYNIKRGVWHTHVFYENTQVAIVENADTGLENSPCAALTAAQHTIIRKLCGGTD